MKNGTEANGWEQRKIWNCFDIVNGATPASGTEHFWDGDVPWVGPADLGKLTSRIINHGERNLTRAGYKSCGTTLVPEGTIILSARAPIGHVAIAGNELCFNQGCKGLVPNEDIVGDFAYWLTLAQKVRLEAAGQGTTFVELSRSKLKDIDFLLPSIPEQRAIASFLDDKCAKIDKAVRIKEAQIKLLRERRQVLIQQAVTRGLNPYATMKDSGIDWIGEIPAHWEVRRNFALFREIKQLGNADLPVLSVSIHSGVSKEELSEEENIRSIVKIENRSSYKEVLPGDIAYNMMRAWQGGIGAVHTHGMVSPAYVVARPVGYLAGDYFELLYRTPNFIRQMDAGSKGIADFRKRLYWDDFRDLMTTLPPLAEQKEIIQYSEQISEKVSHAISIKQEQIAKLKEYKTSLINAAVTGKIKVI
ncbi:hypothetical protein FF32_09975 [Halomonas campaniensis]|uniref:restriction endonuclease subunit S n=1 Tax=Halomonas sp. IOP_6 TaxID=2876583 RepID=UPI000499C102|nr:restriction endonuclease subunit S [Halomonas sp. IOP_6]AIA75160.1 hypothetical protein FF32_09975 [Halomonas campaniensis]MCD6004096.1 restriction endonuclease subunit S [Halomonas sp. IOP_6]